MAGTRKNPHPLLLLTIGLLFATPLCAFDQPSVNIGFTSFVDGGPPAGPGFYYSAYLQYYTADELVDHPNPAAQTTSVDAWVLLNQFIYQSKESVLGAKWGMNVILPVIDIDSSNSSAVPTNGTGLGDVWVGPYLQWDPIMGDKGPIFMQRVEFQMIFPSGQYDHNKALNPGSNFFSFDPYWSGTWFIMPRWTASARVHYLWNDKNNDPYTGLPGQPISTQAGQAGHANFASAYEVVEKKLRVGINGYYFRQFSDSKVNGGNVSGYEQVLGVGPGLVAHFGQDTHLFGNIYFESNVKNRPKGERYILRMVHHF
jgi:anthranilate 1,2-dioxygenase (deaminating, decarboxylating) large subunit